MVDTFPGNSRYALDFIENKQNKRSITSSACTLCMNPGSSIKDQVKMRSTYGLHFRSYYENIQVYDLYCIYWSASVQLHPFNRASSWKHLSKLQWSVSWRPSSDQSKNQSHMGLHYPHLLGFRQCKCVCVYIPCCIELHMPIYLANGVSNINQQVILVSSKVYCRP
jgi:hypothetical protein